MTTLAFCGFNGFGQFRTAHRHAVTEFEEFNLSQFALTPELKVALGWSYAAFADGARLLLKGFLSDRSNATVELTAPASIHQLAACDRFCLVLLTNGRLYKVLPAIDAELQEIKFAASLASTSAFKRSIFGEIKPAGLSLTITHIACGTNIAVAVSNSNAVYSIPSFVHQFGSHFKVKQLLCGFEHALLLNGNGDVYSWGNGLRGQLGLEILRSEEAPVLVEALAGIKIIFIAAAGWHSAAISAFGDLYTWGFNHDGQLGLRVFKSNSELTIKEPTVYPLPQLIELPNCCCALSTAKEVEHDAECVPQKVFTGARHTIIQMSCGAFLAAGLNAHGQLGLHYKDNSFCDHFEKVDITKKADFTFAMICGAWSTVLLKFCKEEK